MRKYGPGDAPSYVYTVVRDSQSEIITITIACWLVTVESVQRSLRPLSIIIWPWG